MITDEVLQELVPAAMARAQEGPDGWAEARRELIAAFEVHATEGGWYRTCNIAHYVALLSEGDAQLEWNMTALEHAGRADQEAVRGFMPSLFASVGACHFSRGELSEALTWYERAEERLRDLAPTPYGAKIRAGVTGRLAALRNGEGPSS